MVLMPDGQRELARTAAAQREGIDSCKYFNLAGRVIWLLRVKAFAGSEKSPCLGVQYNNGSEKWAMIANHHGERQWHRLRRWRTAMVAR